MIYEVQMRIAGLSWNNPIPPLYREVYFESLEEAKRKVSELMETNNKEDIRIVKHAIMPIKPKKRKKVKTVSLTSNNALVDYPSTNGRRKTSKKYPKEISLPELDAFFF